MTPNEALIGIPGSRHALLRNIAAMAAHAAP
jgi:hypothetical protein